MTAPPPTRADTDPIPPPRVSEREARKAALDPAVLICAARSAHAARLEVLENLREDPDRVNAFRAAVACAVTHDGARRVVVLDAGCTGGALAVEARAPARSKWWRLSPTPPSRRSCARPRVWFFPRRTCGGSLCSRRTPRASRRATATAPRGAFARTTSSFGALSGARAKGRTSRTSFFARFVVRGDRKADCLVLGAFASPAVGMAERRRARRAPRFRGVRRAPTNDRHARRS